MRTAVYAGTFDPITLGHVSVAERAARAFDRVILLIAVNPGKKPLFTPEERLAMAREAIGAPNVECAVTDGYVVHFARSQGAGYLVRGVRSATDVESEIELARLNYALAPEIETFFIPAEPSLSDVSSSRLKQLALQGADISGLCPSGVARRLPERLHPGVTTEGALHA